MGIPVLVLSIHNLGCVTHSNGQTEGAGLVVGAMFEWVLSTSSMPVLSPDNGHERVRLASLYWHTGRMFM